MSLEAPPDERFIELVGAEHERHRCQQEVIVAPTHMATSVDPDSRNDESPSKIALGREAH